MELRAIMDELANDADEYFGACSTPRECREAVAELLANRHPGLSEKDRTQVIAGVLEILAEEDFFSGGAGSGVWTEPDAEVDDA